NGYPISVAGSVVRIVENDVTGGDIAVIKSGGLHIIVPSRRIQFPLPASFEKFGFDLEDFDVLVIKIGYLDHEWEELAPTRLLALTPGAVNQDITNLDFKRIQRPMYPFDADMDDPDFTPRIFPPIA